MTRSRLIALGQHRARLIGCARVEREHFAAEIARIESALSWIEVLRKGIGKAREHPLFVALGVAVVLALRPRNAMNLALSALSLWRLYHRVRRLWTLASTLASSTTTQTP